MFTLTASEELYTLDAYIALDSSSLMGRGNSFSSQSDLVKRFVLVDMLHGVATGIHELHRPSVIVRDVSLCNVCFRPRSEKQRTGFLRLVADIPAVVKAGRKSMFRGSFALCETLC